MLQNSNATAASAAAATPSTAAAAAAAANNAAIAASSIQPKLVVIRRRPNQGFGFTLRHFIAYPPEDDATSWPQVSSAVATLPEELRAQKRVTLESDRERERELRKRVVPVSKLLRSTLPVPQPEPGQVWLGFFN